ncbi:MAG: response regulator [Armatimonadetes bacterium]|nr:response regulator [Anaerolineae bacterium]
MSATILYIEDNPQNLRLIRRMLSTADYTILEAFKGETGIQLALQHRPDLILVDINLPDMDGTEVAQRIKATPGYEQIPIIALTANAMHGDRERFLAKGCDGYIAKPVSRSELLEVTAHFLAKRATSGVLPVVDVEPHDPDNPKP